MNKKVIFLVFLLPLLPAAAQRPDALQIMDKSRELSLTGSMSASIDLTIMEKSGAIRNRKISITTKSFENGLEKRMIRFIEPADVRGTSMLVIDNKNAADEMWIYLPALKRTRRIVSSEKGKSFMSSEFSNADMSSPTLSDFRHRHLEKSGTNNQWIIESIPADEDIADEYGYSKKISYIDIKNNQVQKMEFYNFDNELFKVIEIKSTFPLDNGKYLIKNMVANNLINERKSEILFGSIKVGVDVDDSFFTTRNLEI
jgi:hypothetical protein